jgi:hypothetical protein
MKKYYSLGCGLLFVTFLLHFIAIYLPRDFVMVSEHATKIIWLGNGVGVACALWLYVLVMHRFKKWLYRHGVDFDGKED